MFRPDRFDELVAPDRAVTFQDQVGEKEPTLASWEELLEACAGEFDDGRPAQLDPGVWRRLQGHTNILSTRCAYNGGGGRNGQGYQM
jgi:hypothetical protein